ncbi:hypothetical protein P171DRAFT_35208 [Karstenula rhodostoma CBS 690.94]|uniref:Uncharacterized protein n=1 Tax=Karstenula rhodostoma CBS 690.94 TaxID=1392251 RepID=A0A9P4U9D0_9PLEO|nr:hypothetical protein P171DRAFT_35208 [Karstenula rhodostoma CBS 690.94]
MSAFRLRLSLILSFFVVFHPKIIHAVRFWFGRSSVSFGIQSRKMGHMSGIFTVRSNRTRPCRHGPRCQFDSPLSRDHWTE